MKRFSFPIKLCLISVLIITTCASVSCQTKATTMQVFEIFDGDSQANSQMKHTSDLELKSTRDSKRNELGKNISYLLNDIKMTGDYEYSIVSPYYKDNSTVYAGTTADGKDVQFGFSDHTGKLTRFRYPLYKETDLTRPIYTEEQCESIAKEFIQMVADASAIYEIEETVYRDNESYGGGSYEFVFTRMIDDMKSDETLNVRVTVRGRVIYYVATMLDSMKDQRKPVYDEVKAMEAIELKMADIYSPMENTHTYTYEIVDVRLTKLEDGQVYLRYKIKADIVRTDIEDQLGFIDHTELFIRIS